LSGRNSGTGNIESSFCSEFRLASWDGVRLRVSESAPRPFPKQREFRGKR
jgi:hypothetical protein